MDFLKILKSFEEFVYEALTWLVLLPRTLLRIVLAPVRMTDYASAQLASDSDTRYSEAISPPLLLILCVLVAHLLDLAIRQPGPAADGSLASVLLASEQNLLLYRTIAFGVWSLAGAMYLLLRTGRAVNRESLRDPFYQQCYLVGPFALVVSIGSTLLLRGQAWTAHAAVLMLVATVWFWLVQVAWLRRRAQLNAWRSLVAATIVLLVGSAVNAGVGHLLSGAARAPADEAATAAAG